MPKLSVHHWIQVTPTDHVIKKAKPHHPRFELPDKSSTDTSPGPRMDHHRAVLEQPLMCQPQRVLGRSVEGVSGQAHCA
ncbi:hypothetical protein GCM10010483_40390 [Actinokineospora diospyrosa]